jgi:hypothetical protein
MDNYDIQFTANHQYPHMLEVYDYACDGERGEVEFNGYYTIHDASEGYDPEISMPKEAHLLVTKYHDEEPRRWTDPADVSGFVTSHTELHRDRYIYRVLIERRVKLQNTNSWSEDVDDDGNVYTVCYFPTDRQRIWFRVLETISAKHNDVYIMSEKVRATTQSSA